MFNVVIVGSIDYVGQGSEGQAFLSTLRPQMLPVQGVSAVEIPNGGHWDFQCSFFKRQKLSHTSQPFYFTRRNLIWQITKMALQLMTFFCEGVSAAFRYTRAVCDIPQWLNNLKAAAEMCKWRQFFLPTSPGCAKPARHQSSLKAPSPKIDFLSKKPGGKYL